MGSVKDSIMSGLLLRGPSEASGSGELVGRSAATRGEVKLESSLEERMLRRKSCLMQIKREKRKVNSRPHGGDCITTHGLYSISR